MFIPQFFRGRSRPGGSNWTTVLGSVSASKSSSGMLVTPETAMGIGAIRACVTLLAESI